VDQYIQKRGSGYLPRSHCFFSLGRQGEARVKGQRDMSGEDPSEHDTGKRYCDVRASKDDPNSLGHRPSWHCMNDIAWPARVERKSTAGHLCTVIKGDGSRPQIEKFKKGPELLLSHPAPAISSLLLWLADRKSGSLPKKRSWQAGLSARAGSVPADGCVTVYARADFDARVSGR
jgi:hypothetical protein